MMVLRGCLGASTIILAICLCAILASTSLKYRARKNLQLPEGIVDKTIATDGLVSCVVMCTSETEFQCESASWGKGTCHLSESLAIHASLELDDNTDWTTMCRIVYPVFHAHGDSGKNSLTFAGAKSKCKKLGSRVATRQELLDAWAMGFQKCACGWLSDGTVGFVMQASKRGCGQSTGMIECSGGPADVYCVV